MISIACGQCIDGGLSRALPFVSIWLLLFVVWAVAWGLVGTVSAYRAGVRLRMKPLRYLIAAPVVVVAVPH